jgi:hypothetical protein
MRTNIYECTDIYREARQEISKKRQDKKQKEAEKKRQEKSAKARAKRAGKKNKVNLLFNLYFYEIDVNFNVCFLNRTAT